jgi:hypothetical protein
VIDLERLEKLKRRVDRLHQQLNKPLIAGQGWSGSWRTGYIFNPTRPAGAPTTGGIGACCIDGVCSQLNEADCVAAGGSFLGAVPCDPNPCEEVTIDLYPDPASVYAPSVTFGRPYFNAPTSYENIDIDCDGTNTYFNPLSLPGSDCPANFYYAYTSETHDYMCCNSAGSCTQSRSWTPLDESLWSALAFEFGEWFRELSNTPSNPSFSGCDDFECEIPGDFTSRLQSMNSPITFDALFTNMFAHLPSPQGSFAGFNLVGWSGGQGVCLSSPFITHMNYKFVLPAPLAFNVRVHWDEVTHQYDDFETTELSTSLNHFTEVIPAGETESSVYYFGVPAHHAFGQVINVIAQRSV